jgi:hypothetical protein
VASKKNICRECGGAVVKYQLEEIEYNCSFQPVDIQLHYCSKCGYINTTGINGLETYFPHNSSRIWELEKEIIDLLGENARLRNTLTKK